MQAQLPVFSKAPSTIRALPISGASSAGHRWASLGIAGCCDQWMHPGHCRCRLGMAALGRSGHPPGDVLTPENLDRDLLSDHCKPLPSTSQTANT